MLHQNAETHLTERGDYIGAITRLRNVVPSGQLLVTFMENMVTPAGVRRLCDFLGISHKPAEPGAVHAGEAAVIRDNLRPKLADFLQDQYDWVAANVGPLPDEWRDNLQRAYA